MGLQYKRKDTLDRLFEEFAVDPKKQDFEHRNQTEKLKNESTLHTGSAYKIPKK